MSRLTIKLCGVRTPADAVLCAEAGADEIGVVFAAKSKRRVTLAEAKAIRAALPKAIPLVGVFLDATLAEIEEAAREAGLAAAQLHGTFVQANTSLPLYAAIQVTAAGPALARLRELGGAARILLDGPSGGSGKPFPWALAEEARGLHRAPIFVAGGLTPDNVAQAIREARPDGVDVASGIEGPDGLKDAARVRAFVAAARKAS